MAEELPNLAEAVRRANREVWEQASGRKSPGESGAIPPPTGRESPLEGADASAMVAALSAKLSALQARVDYIEDDFPEGEGTDSGALSHVFGHSLSVATVAGNRITCTGGEWYHRTTQYGFADQTFWIGAEGEKLEEDIWLPDATVYVYVELPGQTWGYTTNADDIKSGTTYLRRCIFSAVIADGRATNIIVRNAGDIHS